MTVIDYGERIAAARKARNNMSQYKLGQIVGRRDGDISRYERGHIKPKVAFLVDVSKALGVSMDYLSGITDDLDAALDPNWALPGEFDSALTPFAP
jgi:transcriptional regulator with XRE-family HTH domain